MSRAVVVIINHKEVLSKYEEISLQQCINILGNHPIWMIIPDNLNYIHLSQNYPSLKFLKVKAAHLSTYRNFNRFKINPFIYNHFKAFEYLLYYELDAFVFKDELNAWCDLGYDFIGAPWLTLDDSGNIVFNGVGNGGFSLRKISSHIRVLNSFKKLSKNKELINWYSGFNVKGKIAYFPSLLLHYLGLKNNSLWYLNNYTQNEDIFWGSVVGESFDWFSLPESADALKFSMELLPHEAYEFNNRILPFGCHAWWKYDFSFWKPFIERFGFDLSTENNGTIN